MTALRKNILTPSDQRALQKIARMSPDQMAILGSLIEPYMHKAANQYAAKMIDLRGKAFEKAKGEAGIKIGKERLESRQRTGEARLATERKVREADITSQQAIRLEGMERGAKRRQQRLASDEALKMQDVTAQREALPTTVALGVGRLGIGALGGEAERRRNLDLQRKIEAAMKGKSGGRAYWQPPVEPVNIVPPEGGWWEEPLPPILNRRT